MEVTAVEKFDKKRVQIYIDGEPAFVLYHSDIRKLQIKAKDELSEVVYNTIMTEILPKRAKMRAMNILKSRDKTEKQLYDKLIQGKYPEQIARDAIDYVISYGYVDDRRFAENYVSFRSGSKSQRLLIRELIQKGVSKEISEDVVGNIFRADDIDESEIIKKLTVKKLHLSSAEDIPEVLEKKKLDSLYRYLLGKGFSFDKINHSLDITPIFL